MIHRSGRRFGKTLAVAHIVAAQLERDPATPVFRVAADGGVERIVGVDLTAGTTPEREMQHPPAIATRSATRERNATEATTMAALAVARNPR